jgi:hypothetical protein
MLTAYPEINLLIHSFVEATQAEFPTNLVGIYLTGSLTYDDFLPGRSDIDLLVVHFTLPSLDETAAIGRLLKSIAINFPDWADRLECSFIPATWLPLTEPPETPRPYIGQGQLYPTAQYGNEWIINTWLLYEYGVTLVGAPFKTLRPPVSLTDVQNACRRDFVKEWLPKLDEPDSLDDPHMQSYVVLNLCRILSAILAGKVASKTPSAQWVQAVFPEWRDLVEAAQNWSYGQPMSYYEETLHFIRFAGAKLGIPIGTVTD